jgi:hypothetical protein
MGHQDPAGQPLLDGEDRVRHRRLAQGRLGHGLDVPAFQAPARERVILNRFIPAADANGSVALGARRRNVRLRDRPKAAGYLRIRPGTGARTERIRYASFHTYEGSEVAART